MAATQTDSTTNLSVSGMTCGNCARHVTEAIQSVPGVRNALVNLEARQAAVRWNPGAPPDVPAVVAAVEKAGYNARVITAETHAHSSRAPAGWQLTLWIGVLGTAP